MLNITMDNLQIVNNTVSILDSIEEWPEEVIEMNSNEYVDTSITHQNDDILFRILKAFEMITESLIQKDNFTFITVVTEDVALIGEKVYTGSFMIMYYSSL